MHPAKSKIPTKIIKTIAAEYNLTLTDLKSRSRKMPIANARHLCMALIYWHTDASLADIAKFFGGRHHASVIHARRKVEAMEFIEPTFRRYLQTIEQTHFKTTRIHRKKQT